MCHACYPYNTRSEEPGSDPLIRVASLALTPDKIEEEWEAFFDDEVGWEAAKLSLKCKAKKKGKK